MPQLQNLVLTDRAPTPVTHTFVPQGVTDNVGTVVETNGVPLGQSQVRVSMRKTPNGKHNGRLRMDIPTVVSETINGVSSPKVVRMAYVDLSIRFDSGSTLEERNNVVGMLHSALATGQTLVEGALVRLESVY